MSNFSPHNVWPDGYCNPRIMIRTILLIPPFLPYHYSSFPLFPLSLFLTPLPPSPLLPFPIFNRSLFFIFPFSSVAIPYSSSLISSTFSLPVLFNYPILSFSVNHCSNIICSLEYILQMLIMPQEK